MASKNYLVYLQHILDSIVAIESYLKKKDKKMFIGTPYLVDAVVRRFEIIGEATKNIPKDIKKLAPEIPWRDIGDTRNFLIHQYFDVDAEEVWKFIENDLPALKKNIRKLIKLL